MADYKRDGSGGGWRGGRSFGGGNRNSGGSGFGGSGRGGGRFAFGQRDERGGRGGYDRPQMYKAICDDCGAPCELPFRPSGDKPVFCRDCFGKGGGGKSSARGNDFQRDNRDFRDNRDNRHNRREETKAQPCNCMTQEQFELINAKMDKILKLITPVITVSKEMQVEALDKEEKAAAQKAARLAKKSKPAEKTAKTSKKAKKDKVAKKAL